MSDIAWTPDVARLDSLDLWQHNPKQISKRRADRLLDGWQELGQFQTLAVGPDGECYDGHQRVKMLSQAGFPGDYEVAVLRASRPLTDAERRGVIMHSTLDTGQFDWEALAGWESAGWLDGYGFDADLLADWNADAHNLSLMLEAQTAEISPPEDAGAQVDRAEELRELWGVELGQVWEIPSKTAPGVHRVICGDCTDRAVVDRVMDGEKAGAVVTDPPYGLGGAKSFNDNHPDYEDSETFDLTKLDLSIPFVVWGGQYYDTLPMPRNKTGWVVWDKRPDLEGDKRERADRIFGQHFEIAITNVGPLRGKIYRQRWGGFYGSQEIYHKTQKPPELFEWCIKQTDGVVIDYFLGSGTTIVACERQGRLGRGIEIAPGYVAVTLQRLADLGLEPQRVTP